MWGMTRPAESSASPGTLGSSDGLLYAWPRTSLWQAFGLRPDQADFVTEAALCRPALRGRIVDSDLFTL